VPPRPAETTTPAPTTRAVTTATRRAAARLTVRLYTRRAPAVYPSRLCLDVEP
jgi:hypothetical protein